MAVRESSMETIACSSVCHVTGVRSRRAALSRCAHPEGLPRPGLNHAVPPEWAGGGGALP